MKEVEELKREKEAQRTAAASSSSRESDPPVPMIEGSGAMPVFEPFDKNFLLLTGGSGGPRKGVRPLTEGPPKRGELFARSLIGPPDFNLSLWDDKPYRGIEIHRGFGAGMIFGPVKEIAQTDDDETRLPKAGFTSVRVPNPARYLDVNNPDRMEYEVLHGPLPSAVKYPDVWINIYTTRNNVGTRTDLRFCELRKTSASSSANPKELDPSVYGTTMGRWRPKKKDEDQIGVYGPIVGAASLDREAESTEQTGVPTDAATLGGTASANPTLGAEADGGAAALPIQRTVVPDEDVTRVLLSLMVLGVVETSRLTGLLSDVSAALVSDQAESGDDAMEAAARELAMRVKDDRSVAQALRLMLIRESLWEEELQDEEIANVLTLDDFGGMENKREASAAARRLLPDVLHEWHAIGDPPMVTRAMVRDVLGQAIARRVREQATLCGEPGPNIADLCSK